MKDFKMEIKNVEGKELLNLNKTIQAKLFSQGYFWNGSYSRPEGIEFYGLGSNMYFGRRDGTLQSCRVDAEMTKYFNSYESIEIELEDFLNL